MCICSLIDIGLLVFIICLLSCLPCRSRSPDPARTSPRARTSRRRGCPRAHIIHSHSDSSVSDWSLLDHFLLLYTIHTKDLSEAPRSKTCFTWDSGGTPSYDTNMNPVRTNASSEHESNSGTPPRERSALLMATLTTTTYMRYGTLEPMSCWFCGTSSQQATPYVIALCVTL